MLVFRKRALWGLYWKSMAGGGGVGRKLFSLQPKTAASAFVLTKGVLFD
jgi:hypothetical protein